MRKLKSVPNKISFNDYALKSGFNPYSDQMRVLKKTLCAYSDCLPENTDTESIQRDLDFYSKDSVSIQDAETILKLAVPNEYNGFTAENLAERLADLFGESSRVYLAREGSVCIYLKPSKNIWLSRDSGLSSFADEVSFETENQTFRLWWD